MSRTINELLMLRFFELGEELDIKAFIICSPLIYGGGTGLFNKSSIQIPTIVRAALRRERAIYAGDGLGVWYHTHIEDIAVLPKFWPRFSKGKGGFFFANHGKQYWFDIAKEIARVGHQRGRLAEPQSVGLKEVSKTWVDCKLDSYSSYASLIGDMSETRGSRSLELGWEPRKDDSNWMETVTNEFMAALESAD